jgi:predicted enzyme related to lactoylglutathione lyase
MTSVDDRGSVGEVMMNRVVHFEIPADNVERAKKFYSENFGWRLTQLGPEVGNYVLVQTGPTDEKGMPKENAFINGGLMKRDASAASPVLVIAVDDADATVDKVKKSGGKQVGEIVDIPNVGRYGRVRDTEGNVIGVIKPIMP